MAHVGILFCLYDHLKQLKEENIMAYMSEEGYKKLMAELKELETVERPKISAAIAEARDKGDLSENAEYDAAKEAQGLLEMRINKLKTVIADAKIIDESKLKTDSVQILNKAVQMANPRDIDAEKKWYAGILFAISINMFSNFSNKSSSIYGLNFHSDGNKKYLISCIARFSGGTFSKKGTSAYKSGSGKIIIPS